jgi:predicted nucleotidyltransferase
MRGLINAKWVAQKMSIPPIRFIDAVKEVQMPENVRDKIFDIIDIKKDGCEGEYISKLYLFEKYIEDFLDTQYQIPNFKLHGTNVLQNYVYNLLGVY